MSINNFRSAEPLYIIIYRNSDQAESQLKSWIKDNRVEHVSVSGNRMMLHQQRALECFMLTWNHGWTDLTIWDTWRRQHIYLD